MKGRKGKEVYLYSAILVCTHTPKALRHGSHSFTCKQHHACLSRIVGGGAAAIVFVAVAAVVVVAVAVSSKC